MSKLKSVGRRKRRMDKAIDKMRKGKAYKLTVGKRSLVMTGEQWKQTKEAANGVRGGDN